MHQSAKVALSVVAVCVFGLLTGLIVDSADAHGVIVFAWAEGDNVRVESKFSGGRKVNGGKVIVQDSQGNILLRGTTDDQGRFDFPAPIRTDLNIIVQAGPGHQGEWTISAAEFNPAGHGENENDGHPESAAAANHPTVEDQTDPQALSAAPDLAAIETAVEKALDRKLKPVVQMLADSRQSGPTLKDILGGIGYILGLIGVGAYVHSRKKS